MYFGMYRRSVLGNSKLDLKSLLKGSILQMYEAICLHSFGKTLKKSSRFKCFLPLLLRMGKNICI